MIARSQRFDAQRQHDAWIDRFFVDRLERLTQLQPDPRAPFDAPRLLRHAIYATYVECRARGLENVARAILQQAGACDDMRKG